MSQLFLNNFQTQFIANVKSAPETGSPATELDYGVLRVSDGAAGVLLSPGPGNWYVLTAFKRTGTLEHAHEIMRVTTVDNSVVGECRLVVLRGQEDTAPTGYTAGDIIELRLTAGGMNEYAQASDPRLTDSRSPSGPAGGVLSGSFPNPDFAQAMATAADLSLKVDKVTGKGLSTNDFDNGSVTKLAGIAEQATKNTTDSQLRDRSTHTGVQPISTITALQSALDGKVAVVAGKGLSTEDYTSAEKNKLAGVTAGATANATDAQLRDRSTHTGAQAIATVTGLQTALDAKQSTLVSGTNVKTVNGGSIVGAGDLVIAASDPNAVKLTGAQTVDGEKTFSSPVVLGAELHLYAGRKAKAFRSFSATLNTGNTNWITLCSFVESNAPMYSRFILTNRARHFGIEITFSKATFGVGGVPTTARFRVLGSFVYFTYIPWKFRVIDMSTNAYSCLEMCFPGTAASTENFEILVLEDYFDGDRSSGEMISYPFSLGGAQAGWIPNALTMVSPSAIIYAEARICAGTSYAAVIDLAGSVGQVPLESNTAAAG